MTFGKKLQALREEKGYDQAKVCELLKIEQSTLSNYENERRIPKPDMLIKIAKLFDVSIDYLLIPDAPRNEFSANQSLPKDKAVLVDYILKLNPEDTQKILSYTKFIAQEENQ